MDSTQVEIFSVAFQSGANMGSALIPGLLVVSLVVLVAKLVRSI